MFDYGTTTHHHPFMLSWPLINPFLRMHSGYFAVMEVSLSLWYSPVGRYHSVLWLLYLVLLCYHVSVVDTELDVLFYCVIMYQWSTLSSMSCFTVLSCISGRHWARFLMTLSCDFYILFYCVIMYQWSTLSSMSCFTVLSCIIGGHWAQFLMTFSEQTRPWVLVPEFCAEHGLTISNCMFE
jgi:hypothetical protein